MTTLTVRVSKAGWLFRLPRWQVGQPEMLRSYPIGPNEATGLVLALSIADLPPTFTAVYLEEE